MTSTFAFLFPGQGSQAVGMLESYKANYPSLVRDTMQQASDVLAFDLLSIIENDPDSELNKTAITQPALLATSYVMWQAWQQEQGKMPALMAGHSLGEYTALVCAGAIHFEDAIKLVSLRGQFMQDAVPEGEGAMAAILGLEDAKVITLCHQAATAGAGIVVAANFNALGQVVISGEKQAVEHTVTLAKEAGAKIAMIIPVSVPSHSPLMQPAAKRLAEEINRIEINEPRIPVIHNVNVSATSHPDDIRQLLIEQLIQPVRWVETIQLLINEGFTQFIECGPGKVLTGLCKRIDKSAQCITINDGVTLAKVAQELGG